MQPINMIMVYYWDKKLKKRLHVLEADRLKIKKNIDLMSLAERMPFFQNMFQMTAIVLVSVKKSLSYKWVASILRQPVHKKIIPLSNVFWLY